MSAKCQHMDTDGYRSTRIQRWHFILYTCSDNTTFKNVKHSMIVRSWFWTNRFDKTCPSKFNRHSKTNEINWKIVRVVSQLPLRNKIKAMSHWSNASLGCNAYNHQRSIRWRIRWWLIIKIMLDFDHIRHPSISQLINIAMKVERNQENNNPLQR